MRNTNCSYCTAILMHAWLFFRRVFWALETPDGASIVSADDSLTSSSAEFVVQGLTRPKSLSVDNGKLYWMDSVTRSGKRVTLESADLDGSNERMICTLRGHDPYDMEAYGGSVYWTDGKNMALWTMEVEKQGSVCQPVLVKKFKSRPLALKFLKQDDDCKEQEGESSASAARSSCQDYCLGGGVCVEDEEGNPTCQCPEGLKGPKCEELKLATLQ